MYDTIIVGCGVAGLTAAIYLARANKKVLMLEKELAVKLPHLPKWRTIPDFNQFPGWT